MQTPAPIAVLAAALVIGSCGGNQASRNPLPSVALQGSHLFARAGEAINDINVVEDLQATEAMYSISPALPAGLTFDSLSTSISGTPDAANPSQEYHITLDAVSVGTITISVGPALPHSFATLDPRFSARTLIIDAAAPVRMARADDGRIFYIELVTGNIRVVDPQQGLLLTPFANIDVFNGPENGLLGLALDPAFAANGFVYVHATVPGHGSEDAHAEIIRLTDVQNTGIDPAVIVDHLPIAAIHNGGELVFDRSGNLFVGRGDTTNPGNAQTTGHLSGKVLRYTRDGAIPADNPYPGDPEWSRGLRNTFAMTLQPQTGDLFGTDAGPASDDKLNYLVAGKNFTWGLETEPEGSDIGFSVRVWPEVITPTALMFHSGSGISDFENHLFLASYNDESIRRIVLAGERFTDFIREIEFASFVPNGIDNKPLHIIEADDGGMYVATFNAIYHVYPTAPL